jgi:hypothetical protein
MRITVLATFVALLAAGCACDPGAEAAALAGPDAEDCGYVPLGEDTGPVVACLDAALAEGRSAFGGWQQMGIDSETRRYFATGGELDYVLHYDGDIEGGGGHDNPVITVFPCDGRLVQAEVVQPGYGCGGVPQESYTLCD